MKNCKLILAILVVSLIGTNSVFAAALADDIQANGDTFAIGESVCYTVSLTAVGGDITDVNVYLYVPTLAGEGPCDGIDAKAGGVLIASGITLLDGITLSMDCNDIAALEYVVQEGDFNDADGADLVAKIGTEFRDEGVQDCDQATDISTITPPEPCIEITKEVDCDISKEGDEVTYTICIKNCGPTILTITEVSDTLLGDLTDEALAECPEPLEPDDECCFDVALTVPSGPDPLVNEVSVTAIDEFEQETSDGPAIAEVDLVHPSFTVEKDCRVEPLQVGDVAIFDITVENTGDICLYFDMNDLGDPCAFTLDTEDPPKTWETHILVETTDDIENTILGTVTLRPDCGDPCDCLPNSYPVDVSATCDVGGGATRTPGFWKTHYYLAEHVLDNCPDFNVGWTEVDNVDEMMAIFWEKKAKKSKLCQARIHGSFHAMAAMLNNCHPDGLPLAGYMSSNCSDYAPEDIPDILAGCDIDAIKDLTSCLGGYNEEGDNVEMTFPEGLEAYNAQPKYAREQAEGLFPDADCDGGCTNGPTSQSTKGKGKNK